MQNSSHVFDIWCIILANWVKLKMFRLISSFGIIFLYLYNCRHMFCPIGTGLYGANTSLFSPGNVTISRTIPAYTSVFSSRNLTIPELYGSYTSVFSSGNVTIPELYEAHTSVLLSRNVTIP